MGTITSRRRKDCTTGYTAKVRIMRDGVRVYQESQTFDRKQIAQAWIKRWETELAEPGAWNGQTVRGGMVKEIIERYLDEHEKVRPLGKTKQVTLKAIGETWLGDTADQDVTSQVLVDYARWRLVAALPGPASGSSSMRAVTNALNAPCCSPD
ncbi:MAG TPA: integrase [Pseudomonas sp.]|nr:integrase [Pseudomonas sp.]